MCTSSEVNQLLRTSSNQHHSAHGSMPRLARNTVRILSSPPSPPGKALTEATAGCLIGMGEVVLLPLDVLKIKAQTNPAALSGRGIFDIVKNEGGSLYAGALTTMVRNAPGSFALFGGNAFAKGYIFHLQDYRTATFFQTFVSSMIGAACSLIVSSPMVCYGIF